MLTKRPWSLQGAIARNEPFAAVVLGMLAVLGVVVVDSRNTSVAKLLSKLSIPVNVCETLASAVWFHYSLYFYPEIVMSDHRECGH